MTSTVPEAGWIDKSFNKYVNYHNMVAKLIRIMQLSLKQQKILFAKYKTAVFLPPCAVTTFDFRLLS